MSNALLAMSGPAFGNMDVTVYDVYTVTSSENLVSSSNAITIFSNRSWTWAFVDMQNAGIMIARPFAIKNSVNFQDKQIYGLQGNSTTSFNVTLIGTSTSLRGGMMPYTNAPYYFWTITVYVPSA